jgi:K+-sensing histidine kinase KdpD
LLELLENLVLGSRCADNGAMSQTSGPSRWFGTGLELSRTIDRHKPAVIVAAAVAPLLACVVLAAFRGSVTAATAVLLLVLLVIAAASTGIRIAGIVAAVSGGLWFDFFLTKPYGQLAIDDRDNVEAAVLLVVIGVAVTEVALWGHRQQARANRRAGYLDGVLGTAEIVTLRAQAPDALTAHVADQIKQILGVSRCRFVPGRVRDPRIPVLDHDGGMTRHGKTINVDRDGLPTDDDIALVVTRAGEAVGHFLLASASAIARPTLEQRKVAILLADQAGQVFVDPR